MKGIVFSEFLEFVEQRFSIEQAQDMIDACELESGGAYTSVGTYDHREMVQLLGALSSQVDVEVASLLFQFGVHLMGVFAEKFKQFVERENDLFDFLASIEDHIHVEVRKLYPDAELPSFTTTKLTETRMIMDYRSSRCLSSLAEGLIMGAADQFKTSIKLTSHALEMNGEPVVRFTVDRTVHNE